MLRWALLPVFGLLLLLEPLVRGMLTLLALACLAMAVFYPLSGAAPNFPVWGALGLALACGATIVVYHALLRALA